MCAMSSVLTAAERAFLEDARRAVLATTAADGHARLVPICYAVEPVERDERSLQPFAIWSPLDEKPKRTDDPLALARVRDVLARPKVTLLVDRWSEDWTQLAWVRIRGSASVAEPGHPSHRRMVDVLRSRYPQYADHALDRRPMLRIVVDAVSSWGPLEAPAG
jgi:PPOX class probable F420-dependent enzyme